MIERLDYNSNSFPRRRIRRKGHHLRVANRRAWRVLMPGLRMHRRTILMMMITSTIPSDDDHHNHHCFCCVVWYACSINPDCTIRYYWLHHHPSHPNGCCCFQYSCCYFPSLFVITTASSGFSIVVVDSPCNVAGHRPNVYALRGNVYNRDGIIRRPPERWLACKTPPTKHCFWKR